MSWSFFLSTTFENVQICKFTHMHMKQVSISQPFCMFLYPKWMHASTRTLFNTHATCLSTSLPLSLYTHSVLPHTQTHTVSHTHTHTVSHTQILFHTQPCPFPHPRSDCLFVVRAHAQACLCLVPAAMVHKQQTGHYQGGPTPPQHWQFLLEQHPAYTSLHTENKCLVYSNGLLSYTSSVSAPPPRYWL